MKMTTEIALANAKYNRVKNCLSGLAIVLTTILVFLISTIGLGVVNVQNIAVNKVYPTWHGMYRGVSEKNMERLAQHNVIETIGVRQDIGESDLSGNDFIMISYFDKNAQQLTKQKLLSGHFPEKANDVVLSVNAIKRLGYKNPKIGDTINVPIQIYEKFGKGIEKEYSLRVSGFSPDNKTHAKEQIHSMFVSKRFMESIIPRVERDYRVMVRLKTDAGISTDDLTNKIKRIGKDFEVSEDDIVENSNYLFANYVDPAFYLGMLLIILIVSIIGALTIYSIYYVSLITKIQEFGRMAALGATKKQIRQVILRENLIVTGLSIPIGLSVGVISSRFLFLKIIATFQDEETPLSVMQEIVKTGEVSLIIPWVVVMTIGVSLITVIIASLKPMRQASKIMPIEAIRFSGQESVSNKQRKGFTDLTLKRLTNANLVRNKKRTLITIVSLGMIGVLFVTVSTVFNCMSPEKIAQEKISEDFRLSNDSSSGDKMKPEREWTSMQQNNQLNKSMIKRIKRIDGVEKVEPFQLISGEIPMIKEKGTDKALRMTIGGINKSQMIQINKNLKKGHVNYDELLSGESLIVNGYMMRNYPELSIGSKVTIKIFDGDQFYTKNMKIIAGGDLPESISGNNPFITSNNAIKAMSKNNLIYYLNIKVDKGHLGIVRKEIEGLSEENEFFKVESYAEIFQLWKEAMQILTGAGYAILLILAVVGIMNLVNTTIDSILSRRKELGVMQAIGMSNRQMRQMLLEEGLFYVGGVLGIALAFGSIFGYIIYLYAKSNAIMQIKSYSYPLVQVVMMIILVLLIQLILIYLIARVVSKETIISRIQLSNN